MVEKFMDALKDKARGSLCHQMIMGAGKTTVVGPLLMMMLADGHKLLMQVVPPALLEFSRGIARERFSALLRKPIYTFSFDRFHGIEFSLLNKLQEARDTAAVIVTTPAAIKAFYLKFVEVVHLLDQKPPEAELLKYHTQAEICNGIFALFRAGILMMDEVDLILHPLKSELNFPIGRKHALDLTQNKAGKGLRWEIPFFLLDALFNAIGEPMVMPLEGSREAEILLKDLKQAVKEGFESNMMQSIPHLVLLNKGFYHNRLRPLLCKWLLLWFSFHKKSSLSDEQITNHLLRNEQKLNAELVDDEFMKMLNLGQDLLNVI
jgi:hypothetical protein